MKEEFTVDFDMNVSDDQVTAWDEPESKRSKLFTYAIAIAFTAALYWAYIQSLLTIREALHESSGWRYHIADSGITIGLAFYLLAFGLPWRYLKPIKVCRFIQLSVEEVVSFYSRCWERRQQLKRWEVKSRRLQDCEGKA